MKCSTNVRRVFCVQQGFAARYDNWQEQGESSVMWWCPGGKWSSICRDFYANVFLDGRQIQNRSSNEGPWFL